MNHKYDLTILTERRYANPENRDEYVNNILQEDQLVKTALEKYGLRVARKSWDDPQFNWHETRYALFRTTWDYFNRFQEFEPWFERTKKETQFVNVPKIISWNMDKHYLKDLENQHVPIAPTLFIERKDERTLIEIIDTINFKEYILKPAIAGTARHTYRFTREMANKHENIYRELIEHESLLIQEFQTQITSKGEISLIFFGGEFSHAILKKAKPGDFRVQDDFGGTVHLQDATTNQISFAKKAIQACPAPPLYARVDVSWNNQNRLYLAELELIEPELWFRMEPSSADKFAQAIVSKLQF